MSHCPSCGAEVQPGAKFCTKCGAQVNTAPASEQFLSRCPKCGYEPSNPSKFCIRCGTSMIASGGAKQTPPKQAAPKQQTPPQPPKQQAAPKQTPPHAQQYGQTPPKQQTPPHAQQYQQTPPVNYNQNYTPNMAVQQLCSRMRTSSILLIIAGIMQFAYGIPCLIVGIVCASELGRAARYYSYASYYGAGAEYAAATAATVICIIVGILAMIVAIINFVYAAKKRGNARQIQYNPAVAGTLYRTNGKAVAMLVLNILCGGVLGIIGAAFAITCRGIVQANPQVFNGGNRY